MINDAQRCVIKEAVEYLLGGEEMLWVGYMMSSLFYDKADFKKDAALHTALGGKFHWKKNGKGVPHAVLKRNAVKSASKQEEDKEKSLFKLLGAPTKPKVRMCCM